MKLGELFFDLGIKSGGGAATLRDFMGKVSSLRMSTLGASAAITSLGLALVGTVSDSASAAVAFQSFASATSLSWRELQKWQLVGERANVPAEAMTAAVTKLQSKLIQLQLRGEGAGLFNLLGVEPERATETFHVLGKLMEAYGKMPGGTFANVASGLGLDPILTNLFAKGGGWFAAQAKEVGGLGMTTEQQSKALAFMFEYRKLWQEIHTLSFEIGGQIMPYATEFVSDLATIVKFLRDNADAASNRPKAAAGAASDPLSALAQWIAKPNERELAKWKAQDESRAAYLAPKRTAPVVDVRITGDGESANFVRRVADQISKSTAAAEAQLLVPEAN